MVESANNLVPQALKQLGTEVEVEHMPSATATKTKLKIFPLADRVAIRPLEETSTMKGGLYIPDTAKEKPIQGQVVAVGPGRREKGEVVPMELKLGDRVVYGKYSGTQVELEGEEIILIKEADVIAKLG
jgi:chaperonin GroES